MRKTLALSTAAFIATLGLSTIARAESGPWYTYFQVDACKKMPTQAGCIGFDKAVTAAPSPVAVPPSSHKKKK